MFECNQESAGLFSAKEKKVLKSAIAQRIDAYFFAVRQQNIDTMLEFWADSDEFAFAADGNVLVGYDEFARQMRQATQMTDSVLSLLKYNELTYSRLMRQRLLCSLRGSRPLLTEIQSVPEGYGHTFLP